MRIWDTLSGELVIQFGHDIGASGKLVEKWLRDGMVTKKMARGLELRGNAIDLNEAGILSTRGISHGFSFSE